MSREIKFRAYHEKYGQMLRWDLVQVLIRGGPVAVPTGRPKPRDPLAMSFEVEYLKGNPFEMDCLEMTEFTGLKDKNGKEIYEGDILEEHNAGDPKVRGRVLMKDGCWCVNYGRHGTYPIADRLGYGVTVIGDIYRNPELLKAKP